jgi:broad specificity phosphatase PhoE
MELLAVRHGQASFGQTNYDQLSAMGHRQARLLGDWLAARPDPGFDAVATGAMVRHRETLDGIRAARIDLPEAYVLPELDEFDHTAMLAAFRTLAPKDPVVAAIGEGRTPDLTAIFRFLQGGLRAWVEGRLDDHVPESFAAFRTRVRRGIEALRDANPGARRVLVVSSGGVMSQLAQWALEVPDSHAIDLNLSIRNSALAEFRHAEGRWRFGSWNALPHLAAPEHRELHTYY